MPVVLWLAFFIVLGACVGSFLNVVCLRLPRGQSVVTPPSACPSCGHRLAWHDNLPVIGWLLLRGRCRYCQAPVSARYPLVEAFTAVLFGGWFAWCYLTPMVPALGMPGFAATAPVFLVGLVLLAALTAATIIDAEWFIIPPVIPYLAVACAMLVLPLAAATGVPVVHEVELMPAVSGATMVDPAERRAAVRPPQWARAAAVEAAIEMGGTGPARVHAAPWAAGALAVAALGGAAGLLLAGVLVWAGVLKRSYADDPADDAFELTSHPEGLRQLPLLLAPLAAAFAAGALMMRQWRGGWVPLEPVWMLAGALLAAYALSAAGIWLLGSASAPAEEADADEAVFPPHPHPRREALKELSFVIVPVASAAACAWFFEDWAAWVAQRAWAGVVCGVLAGALIGGGTAWATRIFGTLLFGKEAMGLGDVHLMAGVGAVAGWRVAVLGFFFAAVVGLAHTLLTSMLARRLNLRGGRQIPFGPHLAVASVVVWVLREPLVAGFAVLLGA